MTEFNKNLSPVRSWKWLMTELEESINAESRIKGSPRVSNLRLNELFEKKYDFSPEDVAKANGLSFKNAIARSRRFSIYNTQNCKEFYVARLNTILPTFLRDRPLHQLKYQNFDRSRPLIQLSFELDYHQ